MKGVFDVAGHQQLGSLSPVYWAGASLKEIGHLHARRKLEVFPRSTGPGPH